jgi:energy-coupling factor transport system permease protein
MIPMMFIAAIFNPIFVHEGATIITYFYDGNPLTLESIAYGAVSALMLVSVIVWFSCYNFVMTSDKFMYLFGQIIPGMSLILSMVLRFIPKYKAQIKEIANAQKCIGRSVTNGNITQRAKNGLKILSIMVTWALENGIDTADSMNARGYGLKGRTSFSNFRFDNRDKKVTLVIVLLYAVLMFGISTGSTYIRFYPTVKLADFTATSILVYICYFLLCLIPIILDIMEVLKWKYLKLND